MVGKYLARAGTGLGALALSASMTMVGGVTTNAASVSHRATVSTPKSISQLTQFTNKNSSGGLKDPSLTVAWAQTDLNSPWRVAELNNFKTWAKKLGVKLIWNQADEDSATELSNVQDLLAQHPSVLVVDPEDTAPLTPVVRLADSAHVPLIVIDRAINANPGTGEYQLFIGAQQEPIGYKSAEAWIAWLKKTQKTNQPKAKLAIIEGGVGQSPTVQRNQGVLNAIKPYQGIKVVATESGDWTLQGGRTVMESYIQRFPAGTLQGVFGASDEMMMGAEEAMQAAHDKIPQHFFFTGDGQLQGLQAVVEGISAADTQNPPYYGQPALEAAIAVIEGVHFNGESLMIPNESFNCLTQTACAATKAQIASMHGNDF